MLLRFIHYTYMVEHQMKGAKNMSEIQNAIEVKNLKKGFGGRVLFENFSLNVKANTIHAIIGPNGSGKTTLLRLITGVYQPNAGTINIAGKYAMQLENDSNHGIDFEKAKAEINAAFTEGFPERSAFECE